MSALLGLEAATDSGVHIYSLAAVSQFLKCFCLDFAPGVPASPVSLPSLSCPLLSLPSEERQELLTRMQSPKLKQAKSI